MGACVGMHVRACALHAVCVDARLFSCVYVLCESELGKKREIHREETKGQRGKGQRYKEST